MTEDRGSAAAPGLLRWAAAVGLIISVGLLPVAALSIGEPMVFPGRLPGLLTGHSGEGLEALAVRELRLPRLLLALLVGGSFGLSGAVLQVVLRNPLASPDLLGVSAGASLAMAVVLLLGAPVLFALHPVLALGGGLGGGLLVLVASRGGRSPVESALTGVAVSALLNGIVLALIGLAASSGTVQVFFLFTVGNLANRHWDHVELVWPWTAAGVLAALLLARSANLLQLHDDLASSLGVRTRALRASFVVLAALLVGAPVAVAGPVAWVGLLTPHVATLLVQRPDARLVFPVAVIVGAALLLASDVLARVVLYPREVPVGVCTTVLAVPLILLLIHRSGLRLGP